jgi:hypothetical protein
MKFRAPAYSVLPVALLAVLLGLGSAGKAAAQDFFADWTKADKDFRQSKRTFDELIKGETPATKEHEAIIDTAAQWYIYYVVQPRLLSPGGQVHAHLAVFQGEIQIAVKNRATNKAFALMFARQLALRAKKLWSSSQGALARVNAVQMLAMSAPLGQEDTVDALVEVLQDKDLKTGFKYYAAQGLRDFFALGNQPNPIVINDPKRLQNAVLVLLDQLQIREPVSENVTPLEQLDGYRVYRREIIRALAQSRYPALEGADKGLAAQTALELLRIARNDNVKPTPRLDEQVEAAIGVMRMQPDLFAGYQPDYAAQQLAALAVDYAKVFQDIRGNVKDDKDLQKVQEKLLTTMEFYGAQLADAFQAMATNKALQEMAKKSETKALAEFVTQAAEKSAEVLNDLAGPKGNPGALETWLGDHQAPNQTLYKGVADSTVPAPAKK